MPAIANRLILPALLLLPAALPVGCNTANEPPWVTPERMDNGLVLLLPGVEGPSYYTASVRQGLERGNLGYALEIHDWTWPGLGMWFAIDEPGARNRAQLVADRVAGYREDYPGRPVFLVGMSGGAAITAFTAELIPPDDPLAGVVLLATPLSPRYDMAAALAGCGGRLANYHTRSDWWLLLLTTLFRNFDGPRGATAGHVGFQLPAEASERQRAWFARMAQLDWESEMVAVGNGGGHFGWTSRRWVAHDVAPVIAAWGRGLTNAEIFHEGRPRKELMPPDDDD